MAYVVFGTIVVPYIKELHERLAIESMKVSESLNTYIVKALKQHLGAGENEDLFLIETNNGYEVTDFDPEIEKQTGIAEQGIDTYKSAVSDLAK